MYAVIRHTPKKTALGTELTREKIYGSKDTWENALIDWTTSIQSEIWNNNNLTDIWASLADATASFEDGTELTIEWED